jgi:hypothetical protein
MAWEVKPACLSAWARNSIWLANSLEIMPSCEHNRLLDNALQSSHYTTPEFHSNDQTAMGVAIISCTHSIVQAVVACYMLSYTSLWHSAKIQANTNTLHLALHYPKWRGNARPFLAEMFFSFTKIVSIKRARLHVVVIMLRWHWLS